MDKYKSVPSISKKKYETLKRKEKLIEERYTPVRAPYKKKLAKVNEDIKMFKSEKKARKDTNYELLRNE